MMPDIILLGPQRRRPTLSSALERLGTDGPVAAITSGWQEREGEIDELRSQCARPLIHLRLHQRSDDLFQNDPEFFDAYRKRQDRLHQLQALYRIRLDHALEAAWEILRRQGSQDILEPEREAAIAAVRNLDEHHLGRMREEHARFDEAWRPHQRDSIAGHRSALAAEAREASAFVIAGGHVAVLLYRMLLFDIGSLLRDKPLVAWSAGAMALSESIVLFHDRPPQGQGNPEVLDGGLGVVRGVLTFPNARRRLRLDDPVRLGVLARRFAPKLCVAMDDGSELHGRDGQWTGRLGTLRLLASGGLAEIAP